MRGLAALGVFGFHLCVVLNLKHLTILGLDVTPLLSNGALGVNLFFILSGFLLSMSWVAGHNAGHPPSLSSYAKRRAFRIVPAYYVSVIILALWPPPAAPGYGAPVVTPLVLVAHALFVPFLALSPALDGVYWSLSTEIQFYILLPLICLGFIRRRWPLGLAACFSIALLWRILLLALFQPGEPSFHGVDVNTYLNTVALPGRLDAFAIGIVAALAWSRYGGQGRAVRGPLLTVVGVLLVVASVKIAELSPSSSLFWWINYLFGRSIDAAGFGALLVGGLFGTRSVSHFWGSLPLRWVGAISYSLYIWHLPILTKIAAPSSPIHSIPLPVLVVTIIATSLAWATLSYFCCERPFLDGGRRFLAAGTVLLIAVTSHRPSPAGSK